MSDYSKKNEYKIDEIVDKEFKKTKIGGYNKKDVDEFLDSIIIDFEKHFELIDKLNQKNIDLEKVLEDKNQFQETKLHAVSKPLDSADTHEKNGNLEVLQRLSDLEKNIHDLKIPKKT